MKGRKDRTAKSKICIFVSICLAAMLFTSCDFRLMSRREVEEQLKKRYGREFTVISSESVTDDYYDDDVYRVKLYVVSPEDDPDTRFYAYNIVEGESFGVPGFRNSLTDTYAADLIGAAFEERAADTELGYEFSYTYPIKSSSQYHSRLRITIDPVFPEDLEEVCELLSRTFADVLGKIPAWEGMGTEAWIMVRYREPDWPKEDVCSVWITPFSQECWNTETKKLEWISLGADAEVILECIMHEVNRYKGNPY